MKKILVYIFCLFSLNFYAQIPSYVPTNGLVGWWPFNGNANDESGNGNHLTNNNGVTFGIDRFGINNGTVVFNGVNQTLSKSYPNIISGNSDRTLSCWINQSSLSSSLGISLINLSEGTIGNCYTSSSLETAGGLNSGFLFWKRCNDAGWSFNRSLNTWYHLVLTFSNNLVSLYINNSLINTFTLNSPTNTNAINFIVGGGNNNNGANGFWIGKIDDISIFNRVLSFQEISALYSSCTTPTATITTQSNINFCQGNSVVLNATTGSNYTYEWYKNGTLINGVSTSSYSATNAGNYTVKVMDGSCNATSSATTLNLIDTITWTGNVDNDWHKPCNWSPEIVPECCNSVKIPLTTNSPIVSGIAKAKNVNLYSTSGAILTVNNGANLQIENCPVTKTENSCPTLPVLTTSFIFNLTQTSVVSEGNIAYSGNSNITEKGFCWSTTSNPTVLNSNVSNVSTVSSTGGFNKHLTGLTPGTTYYLRAYATNASGTSYGNELIFITFKPQPAYPSGSVLCNGIATFVRDVINPTTGRIWMDRNLGASQVATASNDASAYGDLYQWGRASDGHQCRNSGTVFLTTSSSDTPGNNFFIMTSSDWRYPANNNLWQGANGINNPCPNGYRLPTEIELNSERLTWSNNDLSSAYQSALKFTGGGARNRYDGNIIDIGYGYYWSSNINSSNARFLEIGVNINTSSMISYPRATGASIRCIKD